MTRSDQTLLHALREHAQPLEEQTSALEELAARAATSRLVLIGEASHGTADFYRVRAELSRLLIERHGFTAVVAEADWPDALRVTRYVRGDGADGSADEALSGFKRFPTWMWRNTEVLAFTEWLRQHNRGAGEGGASFYGMDLYSLHASMQAVVEYLGRVDPAAAARAHKRYACFDAYGDDAHAYGRDTAYGEESCEAEVVEQLVELQRRTSAMLDEGSRGREEHFYAEQNARLVKNAEEYYRAMFRGRASSWNLRDTHMADTLDALLAHAAREDRTAKLVVWAHNSHLGDARATGMRRMGELNVGQLVRERHRDDCFLIGLTTYDGTVTAAHDWGDLAEKMRVRPALPGSVEELLHDTGLRRLALDLREPSEVLGALREPRLERFIGVIYRPSTERQSHYFECELANQYDAVLHVDRTTALRPLDREPVWLQADEAPETFPSGM